MLDAGCWLGPRPGLSAGTRVRFLHEGIPAALVPQGERALRLQVLVPQGERALRLHVGERYITFYDLRLEVTDHFHQLQTSVSQSEGMLNFSQFSWLGENSSL